MNLLDDPNFGQHCLICFFEIFSLSKIYWMTQKLVIGDFCVLFHQKHQAWYTLVYFFLFIYVFYVNPNFDIKWWCFSRKNQCKKIQCIQNLSNTYDVSFYNYLISSFRQGTVFILSKKQRIPIFFSCSHLLLI
jgi:hypothetical protein